MVPEKYNLVLTHSFPTNSFILSGLTAFLADYFNVYFINLPGFVKATPPLQEISFSGYAKYLSEEIQKLNLNKYILGGLSFTHSVISRTKVDDKCRAVLALEPFINKDALALNREKLLLYRILVKVIMGAGLYGCIWQDRYLRYFLKFSDPTILETIIREIDPRTFVQTANLIFNYDEEYWLNKPHILIINQKDTQVSYRKVCERFADNVKDLFVIDTNIPHFPKDLSKEYFERNMGSQLIEKVLNWLNDRY